MGNKLSNSKTMGQSKEYFNILNKLDNRSNIFITITLLYINVYVYGCLRLRV